MGDDERALLAAVLVAPGDDLPRLVYADWLDEHPEQVNCDDCWGRAIIRRRGKGEPLIQCPTCLGGRTVPGTGNAARAEFIRLQIELAAIGPDWQDDGPEEAGPVNGRFVGGGEFVGETFARPPVGARITGRFLAPKKVRRIPGLRVIRVSEDRGSDGFQVNAKRDEHSGKAYRRVAALRKREAELLTHNAARWLPDLPGYNRVISGWTKHVTRGDGENTMIGPELVIRAEFRRGFVEEVRAPLAALFGGPCGRCGGSGELHCCRTCGCLWRENAPDAVFPGGSVSLADAEQRAGRCCDNTNMTTDLTDCTLCSGTGRTPGAAAGLWASQPVTRVVLTDAYLIPVEEEVRLGHAPRGWVLGDREGYAAANAGNLLESIQDVIDHTYPTRQAAIDALSAAACALGRARAGLAPKAVAR